ncbi:MAG: DUF3696 domain-containing protein [Bacteroidaceae bacterium]|nr:DUF3696 domain-containing protein [Bacteroidaceae bacterium]
MIQELTLKGFKSFYDETIKIAPLTVLTGLNSSGKSSVIQSLRMLRNRGPLPGHGTTEELTNIYYSTRFSIQIKYTDLRGKECFMGFGPEAQRNTPGYYGIPQFTYVSADRFGPRTSIPIDNSRQLGERGDNVLKIIENNEWVEIDRRLRHEKSEGDTFGYNLRAWLGAITPGVEFKSQIDKMSDSSYSMFDGHRATNVGFGLSYALPVIVALFTGTLNKEKRPYNQVVLLENPEAHLHPKGQTEMARLICSAVEAGAQVIVETHSDHLFDGIRIYAKNHPGFAQNVATHWFELDGKKLTHIQSPIMEDDGSLDFWPDGLFDQFGLNASELIG